MQFKRKTLILVIITLACWLGLGLAQAGEFSAQHVTRMDSQELRGKIYVQGDKIRQEFLTKEGGSINIARPDKKIVWLLMPDQKICVELPFSQKALEKTMQMPKDRKDMKLLGTETVNGYETEKYEVVEKEKGGMGKYYVWVAKKLDMPIKMASADGRFSSELLNIKQGSVPPEVFEIPAGYRKMPMPRGMPPGKPQER
ncbi:MAG: DUF4412 domain-containing protein [Thermodesulfobacteriota bacterium]